MGCSAYRGAQRLREGRRTALRIPRVWPPVILLVREPVTELREATRVTSALGAAALGNRPRRRRAVRSCGRRAVGRPEFLYAEAQRPSTSRRSLVAAGCFEALAHDLRAVLRLAAGRNEEPSAPSSTAARCVRRRRAARGQTTTVPNTARLEAPCGSRQHRRLQRARRPGRHGVGGPAPACRDTPAR